MTRRLVFAKQLADVVTVHGEGPVRHSRWAGPRWVDMLAGDICELHPDGRIRRQHVDSVAAMIRRRTAGGYLVAGERGLYLAAEYSIDADLQPWPRSLTAATSA